MFALVDAFVSSMPTKPAIKDAETVGFVFTLLKCLSVSVIIILSTNLAFTLSWEVP